MAYLCYVKYFRVVGKLNIWGQVAGNKSSRFPMEDVFFLETFTSLLCSSISWASISPRTWVSADNHASHYDDKEVTKWALNLSTTMSFVDHTCSQCSKRQWYSDPKHIPQSKLFCERGWKFDKLSDDNITNGFNVFSILNNLERRGIVFWGIWDSWHKKMPLAKTTWSDLEDAFDRLQCKI